MPFIIWDSYFTKIGVWGFTPEYLTGFGLFGLPIEEISCGNAFTIVPVKTRAAVDAAEADLGAMRKIKSAFPGGHVGVLFFSAEPIDRDIVAYSRMFAPSAGVIEDPATGSACWSTGCGRAA